MKRAKQEAGEGGDERKERGDVERDDDECWKRKRHTPAGGVRGESSPSVGDGGDRRIVKPLDTEPEMMRRAGSNLPAASPRELQA